MEAMPESLGDKQLVALGKRRGLRVPAPEHRVDRRGFWQFFEVRERWGGADPKRYQEVTEWFRGASNSGRAVSIDSTIACATSAGKPPERSVRWVPTVTAGK